MGSVEMIKQIIENYLTSDKSDADKKRGKVGQEGAVLDILTGKFWAATSELFYMRMILDMKLPENAQDYAKFLTAYTQAIVNELNERGFDTAAA